jgi:hypothetical protein
MQTCEVLASRRLDRLAKVTILIPTPVIFGPSWAELRMLVDDGGTEWEVFDESEWSLSMAMEFDYLPQTENPGLVFVSRDDRRRLFPRPSGWNTLSKAELIRLLTQAKPIS